MALEKNKVTMTCQIFSMIGHSADVCANFLQEVNAVGGFNNYGQNRRQDLYNQTYNLGWLDHPNFRWGGQNKQFQNNKGASSSLNASIKDMVKILSQPWNK